MCGVFFFSTSLAIRRVRFASTNATPFTLASRGAALSRRQLGASNKVMIAGFAVIAAAMLWNTGLSAYHAGVEWKFWAGPNDYSGPPGGLGSTGNLLKQLQNVGIVT